ncbi:MAG: cysteine desulfurase-like protein [Acidobacteriota bacterium]|jgi:cysteine desulfurase family protein (TIGR01976 family)|nr:cysteine desulfurase-like protein [Acidobacteriota bacterium]
MNNQTSGFSTIVARRDEFPSLKRAYRDLPLAYFDGPGGTQVPDSVISAVSDYYRLSNANAHGAFITSHETDAVVDRARQKVAEFIGAEGPQNISFGANMTSLNFSLSRAIGSWLDEGDEILITQLDHEANRAPWLALREQGIIVREVRILENATLDYNDLENKINENTRLVAVGYSSNVSGTVNEIKRIRGLTYEAEALLLVDAVHFAPHFPLDVRSLGIDFLLCSAYKFYGPHVGILYSKGELLNRIPTYFLRTQEAHAPCRIETGTLNFAALNGVSAAIDFIASFDPAPDSSHRPQRAMQQIARYEETLARRIYEGLQAIRGVSTIGPDFNAGLRAPTISFTLENADPRIVCEELNQKAILAWNGHFYGIRAVETLGLLERGGLTRVGVSLYNTEEEVDRLLTAVKEIAARHC